MSPPTPELVRRLNQAIDAQRDTLVDLVQQLVRIPSVTGEEAPVQQLIERLMRDRRLEVDRWCGADAEIEPYREHLGPQDNLDRRPNLVGTQKGAGGGRSLLLNAHIDTVPAGRLSDWTREPFGGEISGDLIYGRGSCDMKGAVATYLVALAAIEAVGLRLKGDTLISTSVGEEAGGVGAFSTVLRGHRADAALISEPTELHLVTAHAGIMPFRLTVPGKSAHAAMRDEGVSAVEKFGLIFQELLKVERERNAALNHPLYRHYANKIPISVGTVHAGVWRSSVPDLLVAEGRVGVLPGEDPLAVRQLVADRVAAVARGDAWLRDHPPTLDWLLNTLAAEVSPDEPIARAVANAHQAVVGHAPKIEGKTYAADMYIFQRFGAMPCVLYGAGDIRVAHYADEHVSITDLLTATKTIACLLVDWCGVAV